MSKINHECLCPGCMAVLDEPDLPCPLCGFDKKSYEPSPRSLKPTTILNGKYFVGKVIGEGGFGITYIGFNMDTDLPVAIKEYFPAELSTRDTLQGNNINIFAGEAEQLYKVGLEKYLREARNLGMFSDLPGIVMVKDFFYENETAYIIMEYINGVTVKDHLTKVGGKMKHNDVIKMMKPVLEAMSSIHEVGIIHRDISPDNIMITRNNQIKLTDFGAARVFDTEDNKSITVVLKRGYAPEEQYRAKGNQGPWTDVYALCATMYKMITGVTPQEALERIIEDGVEPLSKYDPSIWPETEFAIMKGMSLRAKDRYQTVKELIDALYYSVLEEDADGTKRLVVTKTETPVQPVPVAPTPVSSPFPMPTPVQPMMQPTPVQPVVQPTPVQPAVQPTPVQPIPVQPVVQPTPVQPVVQQIPQPAPVQPIAQPTPVQPMVQQASAAKEEFEVKPIVVSIGKTAETFAQPEAQPVMPQKVVEPPKPVAKKEEKKGGFFKSTFKKLVKLQLGKVRFETDIKELNVERMDVGNIAVLKDCLQLEKLILNNNMLDDLSPISECMELEYLALRNTRVANLAPLSGLTKMKYLDLWGTRVTDLHDIYSLTNLTYLCVKNTELRQSQIDDFKKHMPNCVVEM